MKFKGNWQQKYCGLEIGHKKFYIGWMAHKEYRFWGYQVDWHDGPIYTFGLWYIVLNWEW